MNNRLYRKGLAVVLIIAILIMTAVGIKLSSKEEEIIFTGFENIEQENNKITENNKISQETKTNSPIYVDIDGAVNNPGVYELNNGDRVNDAILMAGGLTENAYTKNLNKARKLVDGEKIYIFEENEAVNDEKSNDSNLININTASINDLMSLPGIGEVYAQRIIDFRNKSLFASIDEIKNIEGIGDKTFEKIKDLITIN